MFKNLKRQIQDEKGPSGQKIFPLKEEIHVSQSTPNFSQRSAATVSTDESERLAQKRSHREDSDSSSWQSDGTVSPLTSEISFSSYIPAEQLHQPTALRSNLDRVYEDYRAKTNDLLAKKDAHINRLQDRLASLEGRVEVLQRNEQLSELLAENARLEKTHKDYQKAFEAEKAQMALSYETKTNELMAKLQADVEFYRRQVENCNCQALATENDNLKLKLSDLQRRHDLIIEEKRQLTKMTECSDKLQLLERKSVDLQNRLTQAKEENEELIVDKFALIKRLELAEEELSRRTPVENHHFRPELDVGNQQDYVTHMDIKTEQHITGKSEIHFATWFS